MGSHFLPSEALARVANSATVAISQKARDLQSAGIDVIALGAGEPDFDTPDHIKAAAVSAIESGQTKYTAVDGVMPLKTAVCEKFKRENGLEYSPHQISIGPGGKAVIFNAFAASLNAGDEVIIPTPSWVSYPEMVKLVGGVPRLVVGDAQFKLTPESLERAITDKTKWLILNSPSNPTGAVYSQTELESLAAVLRGYPNVWILSDDIYEHLIYTDVPYVTLAQIAPDLKDRTLTMNGVSKAYAMTGWRIGYAAGPEPLIAAMRKLISQTTSNPSSISQWAAVEALNGPQEFLSANRELFKGRRDGVVAKLGAIDGLNCQSPDGAFYAFVGCKGLMGKTTEQGRVLTTDIEVCEALIEEAHVAVVPGTAFHYPDHFRLSYASATEVLDLACARIKRFCEALT